MRKLTIAAIVIAVIAYALVIQSVRAENTFFMFSRLDTASKVFFNANDQSKLIVEKELFFSGPQSIYSERVSFEGMIKTKTQSDVGFISYELENLQPLANYHFNVELTIDNLSKSPIYLALLNKEPVNTVDSEQTRMLTNIPIDFSNKQIWSSLDSYEQKSFIDVNAVANEEGKLYLILAAEPQTNEKIEYNIKSIIVKKKGVE
ncbi:MAG: hypothetical protein ACRCUP_00440 [Mycoplasmatales bacterium]